jgi:hypothetical protein
MNHCLRLMLAVSLVALFGSDLCFAQGSQSKEKLLERARQEYIAGKFADAEAGGPDNPHVTTTVACPGFALRLG